MIRKISSGYKVNFETTELKDKPREYEEVVEESVPEEVE